MSRFGTFKAVDGKVVQVAEHRKYEPEPIRECECLNCLLGKLQGEKAPEPVEPQLHTGLYL